MGTIKVTNIRIFAYHGCLVEEGKIGSDYELFILSNVLWDVDLMK